MSISDDPRGSRRGQPGTVYHHGREGDPRQSGRPEQRNGGRQAPPRGDDRYASNQGGDGHDRAERAAGERGGQDPRQQQPSFSAYRPEAYAAEKRGGQPDRQSWDNGDSRGQSRPAPEPYRPAPAPERGRQQHETYNAASDPYDAGSRDYGEDWRADAFQDTHASQFASSNYYPQQDETPHNDAQSVHDRFFASDHEPAQAPQNGRYRPEYNGHDYPNGGERSAPRSNNGMNGGNLYKADDEDADHHWDSYEPSPAPAAEPARAFPQAKMAHDDDLDADYFADEDEFDGEDDYAEAKKGGSKKLMAAVLVGAVVTGGGLAYLYKSQTGGEDAGPAVVTADTRPVKERPAAPGGREFPNGGKMIYDRLDSASDEAPRREPETADTIPGVVTTGASGTLEERIQNALRDAKKSGEPAEASASSPDLPRTVRTETIRPDGTTEPSRVQRRQAPAEGGPTLASGAPTGVVSREAPPAPPAVAAPAPAPAAPRPAQTQIAAATPAPPAAAPVATGSGAGGLFVQIAARNDQAAAMAAFADLQQKYASVLGNHSPSVRKVDLGDKGVWYRLLVGPMPSKPDADKLCEDLKTAGMKGCFSRKE